MNVESTNDEFYELFLNSASEEIGHFEEFEI